MATPSSEGPSVPVTDASWSNLGSMSLTFVSTQPCPVACEGADVEDPFVAKAPRSGAAPRRTLKAPSPSGMPSSD